MRISIPQTVRVRPQDLERWLEELGLGDRYAPLRVKPIDAFRTASTHLRRWYRDGDHEYELSVQEIKPGPAGFIVRDVVRRRTTGTPLLKAVGSIVFVRAGRTASGKKDDEYVETHVFRRLDAITRDTVRDLLDEFQRTYDDHLAHLRGPALRYVLRALERDNVDPMICDQLAGLMAKEP